MRRGIRVNGMGTEDILNTTVMKRLLGAEVQVRPLVPRPLVCTAATTLKVSLEGFDLIISFALSMVDVTSLNQYTSSNVSFISSIMVV